MILEKKPLSLYFIPSLADIIFLSLFLVFAFYIGGGLLGDNDTGWHIRVGEYILNTLSIPRYDLFSFINPPLPWYPYEWLSEVIMAVIHGSFGLTGIVLFFAFMIATVYYLLFRMLRQCDGNILIAVLVTVLVIASSTIHWLARPHIFTLLLLIVSYIILDDYQSGKNNRLYLLPFLVLLWVNLHGGFIMGIILVGIYFIGNFIEAFFVKGDRRAISLRKVKVLGVVGLSCIIASLANPDGYHTLLLPFEMVMDPSTMDHIQEFISPNFHEPLLFKYLFFLLIALLALSRKRLNAIELIVVIFFLNMALFSVRHVPLFAVIVAPIIVRQTAAVLGLCKGRFADLLQKKGAEIAAIDASTRGVTWVVVGLSVVITAVAVGQVHFEFDPKTKPVAAVEFLKREPIQGNMFNNDQIGGYIIYAAHRDYKVFYDCLSDEHGITRVKEYLKIIYFEPGWEKVLEKYRITWIIFNAKSPLSRFLLQNADWRLIYADKVAHIFVMNIPAYGYLIDKYKDVKPVPYEENGKGEN